MIKESIKVRYANDKDFNEVLEIAREVFNYFDYYYIWCSLYKTRIIVLEVNNRIVGFSQSYLVKKMGLRIGVIYYLGIKREWQGRGLGKLLVTESERYLSRRQADLIIATTKSDNIRVQKLFKSLGYKIYHWSEIAEQCNWLLLDILIRAARAYEDDILMIKQLTNKIPCLN